MIKRKLASRRAVFTAAAAAASFAVSAAHAQTAVTWVGAPATPLPYVNGANWSSGVTPSNAANEFLMINNGGIATVSGADAAEGAFLHLGLQPGDSARLEISGGSLTLGEFRVGGRETVPNPGDPLNPTPNGGGTGVVVQSGGTVNVNFSTGTEPPIQSLYVGDAGLTSGNTANGSYTISAGSLLSGIAADDAIVVGTGAGTQGTFIQSGGTVTSTGFLTVARGGANASYTMSGGTLQVGTGTTATSQNLRIGDGEYPTGSLKPTTGTFTQTNGTATVKNDTTVGRNTGTGSFSISGSTSIYNAENNINVGNNATGTFVMGTTGGAGPTVNAGVVATGTKGISVGLGSNAAQPASGTFTLRSGTLNIGNGAADYVAVGDGTAATGTFIMEGGTIAITDLVQVGRNNSPNDNQFNMSGGTINAGRFVIGGGSGATGGRGTFSMSGGTITGSLATNLGFGTNANPATQNCNGTLNISGGTYTLTGTAGTDGVLAIGNGNGGTGAVNLSGGTLSVETSVGVIDVGRGNATGSFTLSGTGVLKTTLLRGADQAAGFPAASKTITFNGGTSTITTLTLGNSGNMTVNGGTHTIGTTNFSSGSTFTANANLNLPVANFGNTTINVGTGATLALGTTNTSSAARTIVKGGVGTLTINGTQTHFTGTKINVNAGTLNMNSSGGAGFTVNANSTTNFGSNQKLAAVNVGAGATATLLDNGSANRVIDTPAVTINATGRLDLKNNKMLTSVAPGNSTGGIYNGLQGEVQRAYDFGAWDQPGLTTSMPAAAAGLTTIGVATGTQVRGLGPTDTDTFAGQTITGATTIAMYTYAGDANLDGVIDGGDYGIIDNFAQIPGADSYANGDFNYDGVIDGGDYGIIDNNIQAQGAPFPTSGAVEASGLAGVTAVPEPSGCGFAILTAAGLFGRRRRRASR